MNKEIINTYIISTIVLLILDYIYLSHVSKYYNTMITKIQKKKLEFNYIGAITSYLFLTISINYFILNKQSNLFDSFLLGFLTYGIFDATNYAIISDWQLNLSIQDTFWGGLLYSLTTIITNYINKNVNI